MIITVLFLVVAALGYWFQAKQAEKTLNNTVGAYENSLAWERNRVDNLLVQVQANSQGMQHYPSFGPSETAPESTIDNLDWEISGDDRDFVPAADL